MKQENKVKIATYLVTLLLCGVVVLFSFQIKKKNTALNVFEKFVGLYYGKGSSQNYPFGADTALVYNYLEIKVHNGLSDTSISNGFFRGKENKMNKIHRFTEFLFHSSGYFSRSLLDINSFENYYLMKVSLNTSRYDDISITLDKRNFKVIRVSGLENIIALYSRFLGKNDNR